MYCIVVAEGWGCHGKTVTYGKAFCWAVVVLQHIYCYYPLNRSCCVCPANSGVIHLSPEVAKGKQRCICLANSGVIHREGQLSVC